ncbi:hypothetical protein [Halobacillus sp. K22]|uniref:hypothetical protein n=1 Tax=Halobacillus sp. K22 TaxID=3457431 RepID=UPI003FCD8270
MYQRAEDKAAAREIIVQMSQKQLPFKASTYNALHTKKMNSVTEIMNQVHLEAAKSQSAVDRAAVSLLASLKGEGSSVAVKEPSVIKLMTELNINSQNSFQLFKKAEILNSKASYTSFQSTWREWAGVHGKSDANQLAIHLASLANKALPPFPMPIEKMAALLQQLFHQQLPLTTPEQQALYRITNQLESNLVKQTSSGNDSLSNKRTAALIVTKQITADLQFLQEREVLKRISNLQTE